MKSYAVEFSADALQLLLDSLNDGHILVDNSVIQWSATEYAAGRVEIYNVRHPQPFFVQKERVKVLA